MSSLPVTRRKFILRAGALGTVAATASLTSGLSFMRAQRAKKKTTVLKVGTAGELARVPELSPTMNEFRRLVSERTSGEVALEFSDSSRHWTAPATMIALRERKLDLAVASPAYWSHANLVGIYFGSLNSGIESARQARWMMSEAGAQIWAEFYEERNLMPLYFGCGSETYGKVASEELWSSKGGAGARVFARSPLRGSWYEAAGLQVVRESTIGKMVDLVRSSELEMTEPIQHMFAHSVGLHRLNLPYYADDWSKAPFTLELLSLRDQWLTLPQEIQKVIMSASYDAGELFRKNIDRREKGYLDRIALETTIHRVPKSAPLRLRFEERREDWIQAISRANPLGQRAMELWNKGAALTLA